MVSTFQLDWSLAILESVVMKEIMYLKIYLTYGTVQRDFATLLSDSCRDSGLILSWCMADMREVGFSGGWEKLSKTKKLFF